MDAKQALVLREPSGTKVSDEFDPLSIRVLVVDTDLNSSLVMENMMKQYSYQVTSSHSAEEALSYLRTSRDKFDMVIWDLHMPGTDGLEALKIIGSEMNLPMIITSTNHEREAVMKAMMYGACEYLVKPVSKETIAVLWQHILLKKNKTSLSSPVRSITNQNPKTNVRGDDKETRGDEAPAASKKYRMTWTEDLHRKFLEAVNIIGIEKAVPKQILKCMQEMKVQGLTRNNVASHLQKYRLSLQRNCRIPQETPDYRCFAEPNASASKAPSLSNQNINMLQRIPSMHTLLSNHVMNSMAAPQLQDSYMTSTNNPQFPYSDHSIYSCLHQLPNPDVIDTPLLEYYPDILQDAFPLQ